MKEALKLSLEALEDPISFAKGKAAIIAIKAELAIYDSAPPECQSEAEKTAYAFGWWKALEVVRQQPAQHEPLLLIQSHRDDYWCDNLTCKKCYGADFRFKHTPPQRKPLTNAEIRKWWASENGFEDCDMEKLDDFEQVIRAVEGKHGINEGGAA